LISSPFIEFLSDKKISTLDKNNNPHYPYFRQVLEDFSKYRTFKSGETYRFGIQFQSDRGEWTEVLWLGDKECVARPVTKENGDVFLNNAVFDSNTNDGVLFSTYIKDILKQEGLINYRLVIADPKKHNGRKIKA
jgi:hypothetical protein